MGKPEIITQGDGTFLNGPELYANDGAIHAEINGNLGPHTNVKLVRSYFHATGWALPKQTMDEPSIEFWDGHGMNPVFTWVAPRDCALIHCQAIGYAEGNSNGTQSVFSDFSGGLTVGGFNNYVNFQVDVYNPRDDRLATALVLAPLTAADADVVSVASPVFEVPAGNVVQVKLQKASTSHETFDPYVQFTLLLMEEHL